jgi:hypothetical protein
LSCPPHVSTNVTVPPQSVNHNRPVTWLYHASMRVITHDAHQGNMCDPWLTHFAHASAFRDAIPIEAEQQRDAAILDRLPAECADSCQAFRAAHAAMDDLQRDYDALCDQLGRADHDNERLRDHTPHQGGLPPPLRLTLLAARQSHPPRLRSRRNHSCPPGQMNSFTLPLTRRLRGFDFEADTRYAFAIRVLTEGHPGPPHWPAGPASSCSRLSPPERPAPLFRFTAWF